MYTTEQKIELLRSIVLYSLKKHLCNKNVKVNILETIIGTNINNYVEYLEKQLIGEMTLKNFYWKWTIEWINPIKKIDTNFDLLEYFNYTNTRPVSCLVKKAATLRKHHKIFYYIDRIVEYNNKYYNEVIKKRGRYKKTTQFDIQCE